MELLQAQLVDLGLQRERGAAARETSGPPSDTRLAVVSYEHLLAQPAAALAVIGECHESWKALKARGAGTTGFWLG